MQETLIFGLRKWIFVRFDIKLLIKGISQIILLIFSVMYKNFLKNL